jgi:hypothetical protein
VQAYTLRTAAVAALMLVPAIAHAQPATAARRAAVAPSGRSGYRLSMADMRRYGATMQAIGLAIKADPTLEDRFTSSGDESVEQIATRLAGVAQFRPAFAKSGMTPRQFALTQFTFLGAGMALGAPTGGQTPEQLAAQMGIDPANVAFMRTNQAAIQAMFKELGARLGDDAADTDSDDAPAR